MAVASTGNLLGYLHSYYAAVSQHKKKSLTHEDFVGQLHVVIQIYTAMVRAQIPCHDTCKDFVMLDVASKIMKNTDCEQQLNLMADFLENVIFALLTKHQQLREFLPNTFAEYIDESSMPVGPDKYETDMPAVPVDNTNHVDYMSMPGVNLMSPETAQRWAQTIARYDKELSAAYTLGGRIMPRSVVYGVHGQAKNEMASSEVAVSVVGLSDVNGLEYLDAKPHCLVLEHGSLEAAVKKNDMPPLMAAVPGPDGVNSAGQETYMSIPMPMIEAYSAELERAGFVEEKQD